MVGHGCEMITGRRAHSPFSPLPPLPFYHHGPQFKTLRTTRSFLYHKLRTGSDHPTVIYSGERSMVSCARLIWYPH
jgi:hypothetical protein